MKVAMTGGTGFIGRRVARQLRVAGHDVVCVVRTPEKASALAELGCVLHKGDILDRESLLAAFTGADAVMHLAASYELGIVGARKEQAKKQNLDGTRIALEAAHDAGVKRIVYTSSIVIYGYGSKTPIREGSPPANAYPVFYMWSKGQAHAIALELVAKGAPIVILQPGAVLGPGDESSYALIWQFVARGIPAPLGDSSIGVIEVEDCARAHVLALTRGKIGGCYHLSSETLPLVELARRAGAAAGMPGRVLWLPTWLLRLNAAVMSVVERVVPVPRLFSSDVLRGVGGMWLNVDTTRAREELGFEPAPLDPMFRDVMREHLERLGKPLPPELSAGR